MNRQGTKLTQGINGQAAQLQRQLDSALNTTLRSKIVYEPCGYETHRPHHAVWADGPLICTACHPNPRPGYVLRGQPGFDELAEAARARMTGRRPRCANGCGTVVPGPVIDPGDPPNTTIVCTPCTRDAARAAAARKAA